MKTQIKPEPVRGYEDPQPFLKVGDLVKITFVQKMGPHQGAERMWVEVKEQIGSQFWGLLSNQPVTIDLNFGDPVVFETIHIQECMTAARAEQLAEEARQEWKR